MGTSCRSLNLLNIHITFQNAEIIRKLQKAALQPLSLSTEPSEKESYIFGQFLGPLDTEATFDGGELISFQNSR